MTRSALILALMTALFAGPSFAASASSDEDPPANDALLDESMQPHPVTLPGSYVALPEAIVLKIRNKILESRGEKPQDSGDAGGH